ncbi:alanyl-tRNA editing protein [Xinfangfangia sp. D13-10-4-6]|uniref:alanyl-tRNA editing protein n=1 Tax=Pseudogemmobacter hezensis TaxID=2737662 RepID=UPI0015539C52|nr:alanyl-tRNA editing protein [Pseudogemmobacter hezensis]NPD16182.1 alanyl-tRNA editing protein [Pseudogemmobacter hezensis]
MTTLLFRRDPYLQEAPAVVLQHSPEGGIVLDQSLFFPTGGGQPGDSGWLIWEGGRVVIATTTRNADGVIVLVPGSASALPPSGAAVVQRLDWERRYRHMRMHTALHLLSAAVSRPVTGGQIGAAKSRLDFDIPDPVPERGNLEERLNLLIGSDLRVTESMIAEEDLAAQPQLVRQISAPLPQGHGRLRLVGIGEGAGQIDLQACSGTHVARIGEIGRIQVAEIARKGRNSHRISITLDS